VVRRGVHQLFDLGDERQRSAVVSTTVVSDERAEENQWSSWLGEGVSGGGGMSQFFSLSVMFDQSASCQRGLGLSLWGVGGRRVIAMGAWSDPVEARDDASRGRNAESISGLVKARSMVLGPCVPKKGNRV